MEIFIKHLNEAQKNFRIIHHLFYVTFPLVKDKKILLKVLINSKKVIVECINTMLHYESMLQRIKLSDDPVLNFKTFEQKCTKWYGITDEEFNLILELFETIKKHDESPVEFLKGDNIVILSENMKPRILSFQDIKKFVELAKIIFQKTYQRVVFY